VFGLATAANSVPYRLVRDATGRVYRMGESPRDIMGYSRLVMLFLPWIGMMLASTLEYGWGAASATVAHEYHWSLTTAFWNYSVYVLFEAGVSYFNGRFRERATWWSPKRAMLVGGILVAVAYFFLAHSTAPWISYAGYAALGGIGSGLAYSTCVNMVAKWFPEKKGWRTGFVDGGWAYGAVPFIILYATSFNVHDFVSILYLTGAILGGGLVIISFWFKDPPKSWWPAGVDPIRWAEDKRAWSLKRNPPAMRQLTTAQMWRTHQPKWMILEFLFIAGTSLFGVGFYYPFAVAMHLGAVAIIAGATGFAFTDGTGRPLVGLLSDLISRRWAEVVVYSILGLTTLGSLLSGMAHSPVLFVIFALLSGGTSGSLFVLNPLMVSDYYGTDHQTENYGTIYAAKVVGGFYGCVVAAYLITGTSSYTWAFVVAALMALAAAGIAAAFFQRPTEAELRRAMGDEEFEKQAQAAEPLSTA
jgi:MFS family permease